MKEQCISGNWWAPNGWVKGECRFTDSVKQITLVDDDLVASTHFIPAPVDLHIHGAGGHDCMHGEASLREMLKAALTTGTAALLATSVTAPFDDIMAFLQTALTVNKQPDDAAAQLIGVHLEGPFISTEKLGAQPPYTALPDLDVLKSWLDTGIVKVMTFAPEVDPDGRLQEMLHEYDVKAQIGHSACTWQQAHVALQRGCGITHLYNAMSGLAPRNAGAAAAALAYADYAEIITDGIHVEKPAFDVAFRAIPNLYSVTDATAATGMPDGDFHLGSHTVTKKGDRVLLADGTLAGSCLTQLRSIELLRSWGHDWHTIVELCSARPARWINASSLGTITTGALANWLEISDEDIVAIWVRGQRHPLN